MHTVLCAVSTSVLLLVGLVLPGGADTITVSGGGSLRQAAQRLRGGDTLLIGPGTYAGGLGCEIPSGSSGRPTVIKAAAPRQVILQGSGDQILPLGGGCDQHDIVFDGLVLDRENKSAGGGLFLRRGASRITFQNGEVRNFLGTHTCSPSMAFGAESGHSQPQLVVRGTFIHDIGTNDPPPHPETCNFSYGIYLHFDGTILEDNIWMRISAFPIHGYPATHGSTIRRNVFCNTGPVLVRGTGNTITDNRLLHVGQTVFTWERGKTLMIDDGNTVQNNEIRDSDGGCPDVSTPAPPAKTLPAPTNLRILPQP